MDRRITIALVAVLALLGAYIWFTFLRADAPPITPVTPEPTLEVFFQFDEDQVRALQVRDLKNNQVTRVAREGEQWRMEQPAEGEAYFVPVNALLFTLSRIEADRKLANAGELAGYGLNPPAYQAEVEMQDGAHTTISIGSNNPDGDYTYVIKTGDSAVYLIDSSISEEIQEFVTMPPYTRTPSPTPGSTLTPTP